MISARLAWTSVRGYLRRYALGIAAIACAVGFLVAGWMVSKAFQGSLASSTLEAPLTTTAVIRGSERIPDEVVGDIPGVPVLGSSALLVTADGEVLTNPGTLTVADPRVVRTREGRLPMNQSEVALDPFLANVAGADVGETVFYAGSDAVPKPVTLVGLTLPAYGNDQQVVLTREAVQSAVGGTGWSHVLLFDDTSTNEAMFSQIAARNTDANLVLTSETPQQATQANSTLVTLLFALLFVVLVASVFVISNSFAAVAESRRQQTALLRVVGASGAQVRRSVILEGFVVGAIGTIIGIGLGIAVGRVASVRLLFPLWPSVGLLVWASVVGLVVTLLAVWVPARQSARTAPLDAMRTAAVASVETPPAIRAALAVPLVVAIVLVIQVPLAGAVFGGALAFIALVVLGPWLVPRFANWLVRGSSLSSRVARANVTRNPRRSARVAAALMLGVGLASTGTAIASALGNINDLDARFRVAVVAPTVTNELAAELAAIPGVDSVNGVGTSFAEIGVGADGDSEQIRGAAQPIVDQYPGARLATAEDYRTQNPFAETLGRGIALMSMLALVVGIIGVVNAISLGVWERQRELAVFRALGVEQRQLRAMMVREAMGLTAIGVAFGLILAVVTIYGLLGMVSVVLIPFISWWAVILVCIATVVSGIAAAWWPARAASTVPPTRALAAVE